MTADNRDKELLMPDETKETAATNMRPITDDFYRAPNGEWVYRWSDERLVLREGPSDE